MVALALCLFYQDFECEEQVSELLCQHVMFDKWRQDPRPTILVRLFSRGQG